MANLGVSFTCPKYGPVVANITARPFILGQIRELQELDAELIAYRDKLVSKGSEDFALNGEGTITFKGRLCVPNDEQLKREILGEAHRSKYTVHPGGTKMYQNLKKHYWWRNMKREVAEFVSRCLICQQVKAEHQRPAGLLQSLPIPEWKCENISMDFIVGLPRTARNSDAIWVVVDRLTKSAHFIPYRTTFNSNQLAALYVKEVVRLHGVPVSIVSDRDPRFTSKF